MQKGVSTFLFALDADINLKNQTQLIPVECSSKRTIMFLQSGWMILKTITHGI